MSEKWQDFIAWEDEVTSMLCEDQDLSRGDSQGIIETQSDLVTQCWIEKLEPIATAKLVAKASLVFEGKKVMIDGRSDLLFYVVKRSCKVVTVASGKGKWFDVTLNKIVSVHE